MIGCSSSGLGSLDESIRSVIFDADVFDLAALAGLAALVALVALVTFVGVWLLWAPFKRLWSSVSQLSRRQG